MADEPITTTMTFQPDGGDVPLQWGQFLVKSRTAPKLKKLSQRTSNVTVGSMHKRLIVGALVIVNMSLIGLSFASANHQSAVRQTGEVQALVAPAPASESVQIQPIQAPMAVEASVVSEKAEPTPTPTKAVAAASINRQTPLVGNWDALLQQHFGAAWLQAKKVMLCESGGNARAMGPIDSKGFRPIGLFQIKNFAGRPSTEALMDAATNIAYAAKMSGAGTSWKAWSCKP